MLSLGTDVEENIDAPETLVVVELASSRITAFALLIPVRYAPCRMPMNCTSDPSPAFQIESIGVLRLPTDYELVYSYAQVTNTVYAYLVNRRTVLFRATRHRIPAKRRLFTPSGRFAISVRVTPERME